MMNQVKLVDNYYESVAIALVKKKGSGRFPVDEEVNAALKDKDLYNIKVKNSINAILAGYTNAGKK